MKFRAKTVVLLAVVVILAGVGVWGFANFYYGPSGGDGTHVWGQRPGAEGQESSQGTSSDFQFPYLGTKPQPSPPYLAESKTLQLGNLVITYKSVAASYSPMTMGTDFYIRVKNTGSGATTVHLTPFKELMASAPTFSRHFFAFHADDISIQPNEEKVLHYFTSNDNPGQSDIKIDFWQAADKSDKVTATIKIYSGSSWDEAKLSKNSVIYGYVKDKSTGKIIANAQLNVYVFSGRENDFVTADGAGRYSVAVTSSDDLAKFYDQEQYTYDYFITADKDGYEHYYLDGIKPKVGEKVRFDVELEKAASFPAYKMNWESKVSDYYGFFWTLVDNAWKHVVASQAKHDPQLNKPTNFYLFDANTGAQLWKYPTGNECWGIDITRDGTLVAAGCHDNNVYVVNSNDGTLKWKKDCGGMNREVEFSHDGKYLLTGPCENHDVNLYNSTDDTTVKAMDECRESVRNSKFTPDDSKFVVGMSFGCTAMFDTAGNKIWENHVGEFPMVLAIDSQGNTYETGKGRTLFSFDSAGNTRWSFRVPDHTAGTGAISSDGSRVAIGTGSGWVYYFDGSNGKILWRMKLPCVNAGHNAVSMSSDGKYVAIGCAPEYKLFVLNEKGTTVYQHQSTENTDPILNEKFATIGRDASEGTQKGIMGTYTSADGSKIVAGYADDYIREFVKS